MTSLKSRGLKRSPEEWASCHLVLIFNSSALHPHRRQVLLSSTAPSSVTSNPIRNFCVGTERWLRQLRPPTAPAELSQFPASTLGSSQLLQLIQLQGIQYSTVASINTGFMWPKPTLTYTSPLKIKSFLKYLFTILFLMCGSFACSLSVQPVHAVPVETRRGYQITWNWT